MTQSDLNDAEWRNPANWHAGWLGIYIAKRDTRLIVPKRARLMGFTINFARPGAWLIVPGIVLLVFILAQCASSGAAGAP